MNQDELKRAAARAALSHVVEGAVVGVGSGSTVNLFIDELAALRDRIAGAVSSSSRSSQRLAAAGIRVLDLNEVADLPVCIDGADEIDHGLRMIKGGGAALTREKIVAAVAAKFVCIVDASKVVERLGAFALPVEVIPMAREHVARRLRALGGAPRWREGVVTDNGNAILDVTGLAFDAPERLEAELDGIVGVVTSGLFAKRAADVALVARSEGIETLAR